MNSKRRRLVWFLAGGLGGVLVGAWFFGSWYRGGLAPTATGPNFFVRYEKGTNFDGVTADLVERGVLRNATAFKLYCYLQRIDRTVHFGTFEFHPGMRVDQVVATLRRPIEQQVRIREGFWIARNAPVLEKANVCSAAEYVAATKDPARFQSVVSFPLPEGSLEGYLYPDTYDLPPLIGADAVVTRQLQAFEEKVWKPAIASGATPEQIQRAVVVASMVELEAGVDEERPMIAAVIENRLKIGQKLEIDATVLYALQQWKQLAPGEIATVESPFNTYKYPGLPPGPIGSPAWRSVEAALKPDVHSYLYYVARPDRTHYYSETYDEHLKAIKKARAEFAQRGNA